MENVVSTCSEFFNKYNKFIKIVGLQINYEPKLSDVEFEIVDNINIMYYDYENNKVYISNNMLETENFEFKFSKVLLDILTTKKENNIIYRGIEYSSNGITKNTMFNEMLQNYICNTITNSDIPDINRLFIKKIEKIIEPEKLVEIYFNNDIVTLNEYFNNLGIDFNELSTNLDELSNQENLNKNNLGTSIDKMLLDALIKKTIKDKNNVLDYSQVEITKEMVSEYNCFEEIENNQFYYYNTLKNNLVDMNQKSL